MPRKKKQDVKINNTESLESLIQETYNDACLQISDSQKTINELTTSAPQTNLDVDDLTKIAKEKGGLLKIKDSAIRIKLEIAKLQNDFIKNNGDISGTIAERTGSTGSASNDDFKLVREMLKKAKNNEEETEIE